MIESGYVALGRRGESNQTILAVARGKILPEVLQNSRHEINDDRDDDDNADKKIKQLQGKKKTKYLVKELRSHFRKMENIKQQVENPNHYFSKRARVRKSLTHPNQSFKKEIIDKKVIKFISKYGDRPDPNIYERRAGQTFTPLMEEKI